MKITISIHVSLAKAAGKLAKRLGITRSTLYQRALRLYIEQCEADNITRSLNSLYSDASVDSVLEPEFAHLQRTSLPVDW